MTQGRVDCRGLACPQPVIKTQEALRIAAAPFAVWVDDEGSCTNVRRCAESEGARVTVTEEGHAFVLTIEPGHRAPAATTPAVTCATSSPGKTVVYVASEVMGHGDDELGRTLMAVFLDTLGQFKGELSHAVFVNAGAKLAVEGSPVLGQLRQLEEVGVEVLVCGTCLSYFDIKEQLAVGSVSNMYAIIETLSRAGRVIRP